MLLLLTGLLVCLLPPAFSQTGVGGYPPQMQQSGGFYSAPYPAASPMTSLASGNAPEAQSGPTGSGTGPSGAGSSGPFLPPAAFFGLNPICAKVAIAITRLHSLVEPIKALVVGAFVFFTIKNYVMPYLIYYARAVEEEDDLERSFGKDSPMDPVTLNILRAVSRRVCLERIACQLGKKAKEYAITKDAVRAIESSAPERLLSIFHDAATSDDDPSTCDVYRCNRKHNKRKHKFTPS